MEVDIKLFVKKESDIPSVIMRAMDVCIEKGWPISKVNLLCEVAKCTCDYHSAVQKIFDERGINQFSTNRITEWEIFIDTKQATN